MAEGKHKDLLWMSQEQETGQDQVVAYGVAATIDLRGDRSFTTGMCVHEFVIARRKYRELQGDLDFLPEWPRKVRRTRTYTRSQIQSEYERYERDYVRYERNGMAKLVEEVYGPKSASEMVERMNEAYRQYASFLKEYRDKHQGDEMALAAFPMTKELWDRLCLICDPRPIEATIQADVLNVPDLEGDILAAEKSAEMRKRMEDAAEDKAPDPAVALERQGGPDYTVQECSDYILAHCDGVSKNAAKKAAQACKAIEWATASLPEEAWQEIPGCREPDGKDGMMRRAILHTLGDYIDSKDPDPARYEQQA